MPDQIRLSPQAVAALRSPTRQRILHLTQRPVTARQIADALGAPLTRVYHHVGRLIEAGLLAVVGQDKGGASVSQLFEAKLTDVKASADLDEIGKMLGDSIADAQAAGRGPQTLVGKTIGPLSAEGLERVIAAVEEIVEDFDAATDTDGELVAFTYVVAPVRGGHPYTIRHGTPADIAVYRRILYEAVSWDPERSLPPIDQVIEHPQLAAFHRGWGRPGDIAVIAEYAGDPVGGAFARLFTEEDHGSGYVDPQTAEIAIAVWPEHRGKGVGRRLLTALATHARASGIARLSLAVERENPAARLYLRCGYRILAEPGDDYLMILDDIVPPPSSYAA